MYKILSIGLLLSFCVSCLKGVDYNGKQDISSKDIPNEGNPSIVPLEGLINICDRGAIGTLIAKKTKANSCRKVSEAEMSKLKMLDISNSRIKIIQNNIFAGLTSLEKLFIINGQVEKIEKNAFAGLTSLKELNLDRNKISEIKDNTFAKLTSLKRIDLSNNNITKVSTSKSGLLSTTEVVGVEVTTMINGDSFINICGRGLIGELLAEKIEASSCAEVSERKLSELEFLDFSSKNIKEINKNYFVGLTSLKRIDLSKNVISEINQRTFAGLASLESLDLSSNQISEINKNAFVGLTSLKRINLSSNNISKVSTSKSGLLSTTEVVGVKVTTMIDSESFINICGRGLIGELLAEKIEASSCAEVSERKLSELEFLDFSSKNIKEINKNYFIGLTSLKRIDLSKNVISEINQRTFAGLASLESLDLSRNQISEINENAFVGLTSLKRINLSSNNITKVSTSKSGLLSTTEVVGVEVTTMINGDSFINICGRGLIGELLAEKTRASGCDEVSERKLSKLKFLSFKSKNIKEINENAFAGLTSLILLDLSRNQISEINENSFVGLTSLISLDLSRNQISEINENSFVGLTSLTLLYIYNNAISEINEDAFTGLTSLLLLNLVENKIREVSRAKSGISDMVDVYGVEVRK